MARIKIKDLPRKELVLTRDEMLAVVGGEIGGGRGRGRFKIKRNKGKADDYIMSAKRGSTVSNTGDVIGGLQIPGPFKWNIPLRDGGLDGLILPGIEAIERSQTGGAIRG